MRKLTFSLRGGYPTYLHNKKGFFVEFLYCEKCKKCLEFGEYEISIGLLFEEGFYCSHCGNKLEITKTKKVTKKEFMEKSKNCFNLIGMKNE